MARTRKTPVYMIVGDAIGCIGKDRVLDLDSDPAEPLCDELQCPIADELLVALRKAFTLSYPRNPFIDGLNQALQEIRRVCVEALIEMPEVLEELKLPKIPPIMDDPRVGRTHVFKYFLARTSDLSIKVKYEGKSQPLLKLLEPVAADPLIRTVREIISMTFSEMFSEEQHEAVLRRIRDQIWEVLPPFNEYLISIEVEPIAAKTEEQGND